MKDAEVCGDGAIIFGNDNKVCLRRAFPFFVRFQPRKINHLLISVSTPRISLASLHPAVFLCADFIRLFVTGIFIGTSDDTVIKAEILLSNVPIVTETSFHKYAKICRRICSSE